MKKLFVFMAMFFTASTIFAQDVITLSNGETFENLKQY